MAGVTLRQVSKTYARGVRALTDITLEIKDREFVVLVGPSGCGKSTILRIIAGLEDATAGEVLIGSRVVNHLSPKDRDIAMVFQNYALYPHMSAYNNIAFGLKIRRMDDREIALRVREVARVLNIEPLLAKMPRELSGGERQRVALGRAIVRSPQVFLFDEPLSNLDANLRSEMRAEISALHRRLRVTSVYVTHDQVEAMTMGERIVVLRDGIIMQQGEPLEVYNEPANRFVAGFLGSPPMNFLEVEVDRLDGDCLRVGEAVLPLPDRSRCILGPYAGKKVVLGIRPEQIRLARLSHAESSPGLVDPRPQPMTGERYEPGQQSNLSAEVTLVEPTGGESLVYATVGNTPIAVRAAGTARVRIGDEIGLGLNLERALFFDMETEERILDPLLPNSGSLM